MLWDRGSWEPIGDPVEGLRKGKLEFNLHGESLKGQWALVRMKPRGNEKRSNWLLIKHHDKYANEDETDELLNKHNVSISTKRGMEDIRFLLREAEA